MVLNGMDESLIAKQYFSTKSVNATGSIAAPFMDEMSLINVSKEALSKKDGEMSAMAKSIDEATSIHQMDNAFVIEMAGKNIKDFKVRARGNVVPRVAKRIIIEE